MRACVERTLEVLGSAGFALEDVDLAELALVDRRLETIVLKEAYDVHRVLLEREGDGYGPGTRALIEAGAGVDDETYRSGLADRERVAVGFARVFEEVDVLAGPTVAYPAPRRTRRSGRRRATSRRASPRPTTSRGCPPSRCRAASPRATCPPVCSSPPPPARTRSSSRVAATLERLRA